MTTGLPWLLEVPGAGSAGGGGVAEEGAAEDIVLW